ncbi:MAG: hypothetical protein WED07_01275 [Candidatus Freyarchaeum deiterrae]
MVILTSLTYKTDYTRDQIVAECNSRLPKSGFHTRQEGNLVRSTDGRDYSTGIIVACVILCLFTLIIGLIVLLAYYFTRTQNKIIIDMSTKGKFTITYEGKKATDLALGLSNVLRSGEFDETETKS